MLLSWDEITGTCEAVFRWIGEGKVEQRTWTRCVILLKKTGYLRTISCDLEVGTCAFPPGVS